MCGSCGPAQFVDKKITILTFLFFGSEVLELNRKIMVGGFVYRGMFSIFTGAHFAQKHPPAVVQVAQVRPPPAIVQSVQFRLSKFVEYVNDFFVIYLLQSISIVLYLRHTKEHTPHTHRRTGAQGERSWHLKTSSQNLAPTATRLHSVSTPTTSATASSRSATPMTSTVARANTVASTDKRHCWALCRLAPTFTATTWASSRLRLPLKWLSANCWTPCARPTPWSRTHRTAIPNAST